MSTTLELLQVEMIDKILQTMHIEVLVGDSEVIWSHDVGCELPKKREDVEGYTRVTVSDRQTLQDVSKTFVVCR